MSTATAEDPRREFDAICEQASRNNARNEVTGVLILHGRTFLQVLEGPKAVVEDTFLRIMADDRHRSLLLLSRQLRTSRQFGDWGMVGIKTVNESSEVIERVRHMLGQAPSHARETFNLRFG